MEAGAGTGTGSRAAVETETETEAGAGAREQVGGEQAGREQATAGTRCGTIRMADLRLRMGRTARRTRTGQAGTQVPVPEAVPEPCAVTSTAT